MSNEHIRHRIYCRNCFMQRTAMKDQLNIALLDAHKQNISVDVLHGVTSVSMEHLMEVHSIFKYQYRVNK